MELDAQSSYYNVAGPGGFSGSVCNGPSSVGVVKNLVCFMKKEIAKQIPEFSPKKGGGRKSVKLLNDNKISRTGFSTLAFRIFTGDVDEMKDYLSQEMLQTKNEC